MWMQLGGWMPTKDQTRCSDLSIWSHLLSEALLCKQVCTDWGRFTCSRLIRSLSIIDACCCARRLNPGQLSWGSSAAQTTTLDCAARFWGKEETKSSAVPLCPSIPPLLLLLLILPPHLYLPPLPLPPSPLSSKKSICNHPAAAA